MIYKCECGAALNIIEAVTDNGQETLTFLKCQECSKAKQKQPFRVDYGKISFYAFAYDKAAAVLQFLEYAKSLDIRIVEEGRISAF